MLKWILIVITVIIIGGAYYVLKKGGGLEMQPEHAVETPTQTPAAAPKK